MSIPLNLIISESKVERGLLNAEPPTRPNIAVVYSTGAGQVASFGGRPLKRSEQLFSQYRFRYDVDMSDHRRRAELRSTPLPARGDYYFFVATVDVMFRVHDPVEIVRRAVHDPLPIVYGHIAGRLWNITRGFDIEDSAKAESAARQAFSQPVTLPEGLQIGGVSVQLLPDAQASDYLQKKRAAERALQTGDAEHQVNVQKAMQQAQLSQMAQVHQLQARQAELTAMGNGPLSAHEMARRHLAGNPQDTAHVMHLLMEHERAMIERQDGTNQRVTDFVKFMMQSGVIPPGDFDRFIGAAAGQLGLPGGPPAALTAGAGWSHAPVLPPAGPQPVVPAQAGPPVAEKPEAVILQQDPATKVWRPADGVQPMYLMVDESTAAAPYISDLSDGVRGLLGTLAQASDIAPAIRLSVLGFADGVATRLPLDQVTAASQSPWLITRGDADYAGAFETLLDQITPDIEALKQQGLKVLRPVVFLLSASAPGDDGWRAQHRRLVDPAGHRYAPGIVAYGVGEAAAPVVAAMATRPEFGYVMTAGTDVHTAIDQSWRALSRDIIAAGRALVSGSPALTVQPPTGFRLAGEPV
ncbi:hypothetical protein [Actinoplanes sp. N902-109]|uniref:vWA domain-containing protein n=1 Tax=Actinoplanes sp. (strain N902-109) TaxID=649831 RepID=UPI0003293712|nr:hypothetical protein [Actinoplanes sp. N902-109]AGL18926.1 hypothetical protein L083_5416 [Actinoplanes sp. N902-109]